MFIGVQVHSHFTEAYLGVLHNKPPHLSSSALWEEVSREGANLVFLALKEKPAIKWRKSKGPH